MEFLNKGLKGLLSLSTSLDGVSMLGGGGGVSS